MIYTKASVSNQGLERNFTDEIGRITKDVEFAKELVSKCLGLKPGLNSFHFLLTGCMSFIYNIRNIGSHNEYKLNPEMVYLGFAALE